MDIPQQQPLQPNISEPNIWEANPKLKTLLLILIFVFLGSGIALVVFAQWSQNFRQQVYEQTKAGLPVHKAGISDNQNIGESNTNGWKTYKNDKYGFELKYPSNLSFQNGGTSYDLGTSENQVYGFKVGDVELTVINTADLHKKVNDYLSGLKNLVGGIDSAKCTDIHKLPSDFSRITTYNCGAEGFSAFVEGASFDIFAEKLFQDPSDTTTDKILSTIKFTK